MLRLIFIVLAIAAIYFIYRMSTKIRDKVETKKVIQMSLYGKKWRKTGKQTCSFCRKKAHNLSFYSDEQGKVVGVCDACRPQAERRALTRL